MSNTPPPNGSTLSGFRHVRSAIPSSVLTLDQETAVELGFAKPIDDFDHQAVGKLLDKPNWQPANQFARVAGDIGAVIVELEYLRDVIHEIDKQIPDIQVERGVRNSEIDGFRQFKRNLDKAVDDLDMITLSLKKLYKSHPERHAYFAGPDGKTIVADAEQWSKDNLAAKRELSRASAALRKFTDGFRKLGGDAEYLYLVNKRMDVINEHMRGIGRYGNAAYWADHAKPDLPDDIYG